LPRTQFSVFCEAHHIEELKRVGLWQEPTPPEERLVKQCQRVSRNLHLGAVTPREALNSWHDLLLYECLCGRRDVLGASFAIMPVERLRELLSAVISDPHRDFAPRPIQPDAAYTERILAANQALREEIEKWLAKK
jgi:hypothetical protein